MPTVISIITFVGLSVLPCANASPYIISDSRIRSLDITPNLGRGYSLMTNSYYSSCLNVEETTSPSYNYDNSAYDFTQPDNNDEALRIEIAKKFSYSFGYSKVQAKLTEERQPRKAQTTTRYVATSMRVERQATSIREDMSTIIPPAAVLLDNRDYIGFFKACGPTYIRGIRRAQEVAAILVYESSESDKSSKFAKEIQISNWSRNSNQPNPAFLTELQSLEIIILGYGLGLKQDGSATLVAKTIEQYHQAMNFAFRTMIQVKSYDIGMVYGMEIVPWVENNVFVVQSQVLDEVVEVPVPAGMIPVAYNPNDKAATFTNSDEDRVNFRCKAPSHQIDKLGVCCEPADLYDYSSEVYDSSSPQSKVCKPMHSLDPNKIRDNLITNAEFITRLDTAFQIKRLQLNKLEQCVSAARGIPERYDFNYLRLKDGTQQFADVMQLTLLELKLAIDPFGDFSLVTHMANEIEEMLDRFINPCYETLFSKNDMTVDDSTSIMAYPWYSHDVCRHLSCLGQNMRWDRSNPSGGCVPSIMGSSSPKYKMGVYDNCRREHVYGAAPQCKYSTATLAASQDKLESCWTKSLPQANIDYYLNRYCMPVLSSKIMEDDAVEVLNQNVSNSCGAETEEVYFQGTLYPDEYLYSSSREYFLVYQSDGNLVLYQTSTGLALWSSNTSQYSTGFAMMDGYLRVFDGDGNLRYTTPTGYENGFLRVEDSGNLAIFHSTGSSAIAWQTNTAQ